MDPIEFPEKYENLMRIAKQSLIDKQYEKAREWIERAYSLKETFEANSLLVLCMYELDQKKEALRQALVYEKEYLSSESFAEIYFDLLISTKDYLYARKLIASADFTEAFEQGLIDKIQRSEELTNQLERQKIRKIYQIAATIPKFDAKKQFLFIKEVEQLPYHEFLHIAKKLIVMPEVHLLVRAKLLESLMKVRECHTVEYLTIEEKLIQVIPNELKIPEQQSVYLKLCELAQSYANLDTILSEILKEEFTIQAALIYPIYETYINDPMIWFDCSLAVYDPSMEKKPLTFFQKEFDRKKKEILSHLFTFY